MVQQRSDRPARDGAQSRQSSRGETTARLRHDIDRGGTGDKVPFMDPAAAPLGTDDEAAGTSPTPDQIAHAREMETRNVENSSNASARPRTVGELAGNQTRRGLRPILIFGAVMVLVVIVAIAL
ncbi:hypothetical protein [Rhodobacter sp. NSM]|uniref:hypothetical protein n=1 Tax=Rhodobacter sp. NSM TaxID=3457501 RepID=UPI003FD60F56